MQYITKSPNFVQLSAVAIAAAFTGYKYKQYQTTRAVEQVESTLLRTFPTCEPRYSITCIYRNALGIDLYEDYD
ncbi:MAG: hypothetical protein Faunusvirus5_7 [Faunusvirus sp.]|jgi:hypothetical protein|uniref:Uncharacterized protein n=1 Tax=Faunusvirus sp. TaxID=2487766 RepID=A0A3G4ZWB5_9VIRU|nr:MAG: hypothetical protein Faunusvirus5_7 [Faunusvirus sp.]